MDEHDLVIIGSGPAGEKAAAQAAYFGKQVAIVEKAREPGGAAVHTGTLPSKTLRESALYLSGYRARDLYGVAVELERTATLQRLMARKTAIADAESRRIRANLARHDVTYLQGHARFVDTHVIEVEERGHRELVRGRYFLIATGSKPHHPPDIDFASDDIHDSDEILHIDRIPKTMIVLGGGVIGCEYACMFAALGVDVTLVDARPAILPFLDHELCDRLRGAMEKLGIRLRLGAKWGRIAATSDGVTTELGGETLRADELLFAAGRVGCTDQLGLEKIGVIPNSRGYLDVDTQYRTSVPHVFAAGDVVGFPALASVSMEQGRIAVCHAFGFTYKQHIGPHMPYGIYTIPEVSAIGETEETCREKRVDYVVGRARFDENARGLITGDLEGITKLIVHRKTRRVLGVHVLGEHATELVHIGQAAMYAGATVDIFIDMVFNFPTLAESYKYAAYDCLRALATRATVAPPP